MGLLEKLGEGAATARGAKLVVVIDAWPVRLDSLGELRRALRGWLVRPLFAWVNPKYAGEAEELIREAYGGERPPPGPGVSLLRAFVDRGRLELLQLVERVAEYAGGGLAEEASEYVGDIGHAATDVERAIRELVGVGARLQSGLELTANYFMRIKLRRRISRQCSGAIAENVGGRLYAVLSHECTLALPLLFRQI